MISIIRKKIKGGRVVLIDLLVSLKFEASMLVTGLFCPTGPG